MEETYTHGHQEAVLRSHRWRTAANSAAYLLPHLEPGMQVLDVGCGPGTITAELAGLVKPGRVVGVDRSTDVIEEARRAAGSGDQPESVEFREGDVYGLDFDSGVFDVVHAHQVLQHLAEPVAALAEMRRVLRPSGRLAVRDADYGAFVWYPDDHRLDRWRQIYSDVARRNGGEPDAGRRLPEWVAAAGFSALEVSTSTWTFADRDSREWWTDLWAERTVGSDFAAQTLDYGLSTRGEMDEVAEGWRSWGARGAGIFVVLHVEVMARA